MMAHRIRRIVLKALNKEFIKSLNRKIQFFLSKPLVSGLSLLLRLPFRDRFLEIRPPALAKFFQPFLLIRVQAGLNFRNSGIERIAALDHGLNLNCLHLPNGSPHLRLYCGALLRGEFSYLINFSQKVVAPRPEVSSRVRFLSPRRQRRCYHRSAHCPHQE
jgi:hypothetical protein